MKGTHTGKVLVTNSKGTSFWREQRLGRNKEVEYNSEINELMREKHISYEKAYEEVDKRYVMNEYYASEKGKYKSQRKTAKQTRLERANTKNSNFKDKEFNGTADTIETLYEKHLNYKGPVYEILLGDLRPDRGKVFTSMYDVENSIRFRCKVNGRNPKEYRIRELTEEEKEKARAKAKNKKK